MLGSLSCVVGPRNCTHRGRNAYAPPVSSDRVICAPTRKRAAAIPKGGASRAAMSLSHHANSRACRARQSWYGPGRSGEVSEWLKVPDSKSGEASRPPRVRIPPSPPTTALIDSISFLLNPPRMAAALGEVSEWPKVQHWKCCVVHATAGSNPALSATPPEIALGGLMPRATVFSPTPSGPEGSSGNEKPGARGLLFARTPNTQTVPHSCFGRWVEVPSLAG